MKTLSFTKFLLIILICFISISCSSTLFTNAPAFDPEILIGTKWVEIEPSPGFTFSLEFEDTRFVLWSFQNTQLYMEYMITGSTITLANHTSYILNGDILYRNSKPYLIKK